MPPAACANASALAQAAGGKFGFLTAGGNTVGGYLAGATPGEGGRTAEQMLRDPLKAYFVMNAEPLLDSDNGAKAVETLKAAGLAVALTSYRSAAEDWADVMLPIAPFTETSGTFVNAEGRAQSFKGTAAPQGEARPAWKVLRVLGNLFQLSGFDEESSEAVRDAVLSGDITSRLSNSIKGAVGLTATQQGIERVTDVPIYRTDAIVRRAGPLQETPASLPPVVRASSALLEQLGVQSGDTVRVSSTQGSIELPVQQDEAVAAGSVRISAGFAQTAPLGSAFGQLTLERI